MARKLVARQPGMTTELPPVPQSLEAVSAALQQCTRCNLCQYATAAVAGEGPRDARLMIVGEQAGDEEDLAGRPFIGPAGKVLDEALAEAGIERKAVYLTNAVKHFKFKLRGKKRIHQRPHVSEIESCRWWLDLEREFVQPPVTLALGATAARALLDRPVKIADVRGQALAGEDGRPIVITVHPAYLLRLPDRSAAREERARFIEELRFAQSLAA